MAEVLIVGTGAMACLFAARLSAANVPAIMLGSWQEGLSAIRTNGVREVSDSGSERPYPVQVTSDAEECREIPFALVLVKSWQTKRAASQLGICLPDNGLVITLQNGLGNYEILIQQLGSSRVVAGSITSGAYLKAPGIVLPAGEGVIKLGVHGRLKPFADLLGKAGFFVESDLDIHSLLWGKLVINAAINPLTALLRVPNGELLERPPARVLMTATAREAAAVAVALGVDLPFPDPVVAAEAIARRTRDNYSSMLQDIRRGAPTEIDSICGEIVRAGLRTGLPTPVNRTLQQLVRAVVYGGKDEDRPHA